ncbi:RNA-binding 14 isoform X1 [Pelobates cultripes]|nr:RNA-binding 14 isoform X1 [Pelobates cultripes]
MKIFIGNVDDQTNQDELSALFEKYGPVLSCAVMKQYAFVHMRGKDGALKAIEELNGLELHGKKMVVELSKPRPQNTWKIFVGNVSSGCDITELRKMFEAYGRVVECDVVKDFAFVHMERESDAREAIKDLNGKNIKGKRINVELSNKCQKPSSSNGSSHSSRSRRPHDLHEPLTNHVDVYDRRRATEAAYASYALRSPHERYMDTVRYNSYESHPRPPSPLYYSRDRSPIRRSPPRSSYSAAEASAILTSKYRQSSAALASAYGSQSSLSSAYGTHSSTYGADLDAYRPRGSTLSSYGTHVSSMASSLGNQSSSSPYAAQSSSSPYASSALVNSYRQQPNSAYESSKFAGLGQQSAYSTVPPMKADPPMYERTRLSPPRSSITDRISSDRHYSALSDYRHLADSQAIYRRSPPKSQVDYRRSLDSLSDYTFGDYLRPAPLSSSYQRRL